MTTRTELLDSITNGENSQVEFKRDDISADALAKELVAFSNMEGGMVLLGVEDDGSVSGTVRENLEEWVMSLCRDKIRPAIIPFFETFPDIRDGKTVAAVRVLQGHSVHALWHNNSSRYIVRVGSQSREASQEELARLFQKRRVIRAEMQPVSGAEFKDLHLGRLQNYFRDIRQQPIPDSEPEWKSLLVNTEVMTEEGVTQGGMLLFGNEPNHYLPHAGIHAVAYLGEQKEYESKERLQLRGAMTPRLSGAGNIKKPADIVENGLVEQAMHFVQRNILHTAKIVGGRRIDRSAYPTDVVREVVVNALVHRDYLFPDTDIELSIYSDRLEVISPGRLPNGVTADSIKAGVRVARNQLLREVMRDYGYVEGAGMGIPRTVIEGMRQHNDTEPDFISKDERFIVRLFA